MASGIRAHAIVNFVTAANGGSFVLGDNNTVTLTSSASNQLSMSVVGGYRLFSNSTSTTGETMAAGGSGWTKVCARNLKENFSPVDGERLRDRIRRLPITEWNATTPIHISGTLAPWLRISIRRPIVVERTVSVSTALARMEWTTVATRRRTSRSLSSAEWRGPGPCLGNRGRPRRQWCS